jgi:hypothetical protein
MEQAQIDGVSRPPGGDVDYGVHGIKFSQQRRTDPRIAAYVHQALGSARTVLD